MHMIILRLCRLLKDAEGKTNKLFLNSVELCEVIGKIMGVFSKNAELFWCYWASPLTQLSVASGLRDKVLGTRRCLIVICVHFTVCTDA